ncbi:bis(5'-nucleosyl)-tetraphosphatase (symmetrical) YqeK [Peloplasma aerotolerans]|jgi:predicted HD superfamily hydrolase involved in NAD metabolism|uniref:bis(5'-nucleosyl)-tetraphosphatase (symmetrical) n=1 Tax=Peloplasma aerotolerans TaxID=3044389 RepID=A0AAW6U6V7_9MOLU|nr:bis(5'-nucleosyl)-tetraphosphatase (symmetrical) YqeK [Mariniplasma sp. M4Ah]MDI6452309.1 bis(5'-nucleosyl)-tetraphosphatase (symmetrical) YqeK [Mariniplasma sp. M4Ah]MDR4968085.1 bis(5'-nucleosyl)-tetraphosphatase (symmetrical) YqeK [Acholeplasmataceae bacterium]
MIEQIKEKVTEKLKHHKKRLQHVFGVYETAVKLAKIHGVDEKKVAIAALYHDYSKYDTIEEQIQYLDLKSIKEYVDYPVIYHALSAAAQLEYDFKIRDKEILNAIKYHVWGRPNMTDIEKIIFISDSCEPNRKFKDCDMIYEMATKDLDLAVEHCMKISIEHVYKKQLTPSEEQFGAYAYYKEVNSGKT